MLRQELSTTNILVGSVSIGCPLCLMFVCPIVPSILVLWNRHYLWPVANSECSNMSENLSVDFQQDRECLYPTVSLHLDFLHIWHISCAYQVIFLWKEPFVVKLPCCVCVVSCYLSFGCESSATQRTCAATESTSWWKVHSGQQKNVYMCLIVDSCWSNLSGDLSVEIWQGRDDLYSTTSPHLDLPLLIQ